MHLIGAHSPTLPLFSIKTLHVVHPRRGHVGAWWRGNSGLTVQNHSEAFGGRGAHILLEQASQVGSKMVKLREFVVGAVETLWGAVTLDGQVSPFVGAHVCVFVGEVAGSAADPTVFVFRGFCVVLHVVVEQEAPVTLSVGLGDSR